MKTLTVIVQIQLDIHSDEVTLDKVLNALDDININLNGDSDSNYNAQIITSQLSDSDICEKMKVISIQDYANLIGYKGKNPTLQKIQKFAEDDLDLTIWDYPVEEYDYVLKEVHDNCSEELVYVETEIGIRVCEL